MKQERLEVAKASEIHRSGVILVVALACILLAGCETTAQRLDRQAEGSGLSRLVVDGTEYRHLIYKKSVPGTRVFVFIEGDGRPWIDGRVVATDPTPKNALAFNLMLQSEVPAVYLGRPCYFGISSKACESDDWTHARFSEEIVQSMQAAIAGHVSNDEGQSIILIGYSGGGALAMLLAPRISGVEAVVTIAGLLDTDAWTDHHGYEPLSGSLNPAHVDIPDHIHQVHIIAEQDHIVPPSITRNALKRWPNAEVWSFDTFDHACCWNGHWTKIFPRLLNALKDAGS
jgi:hypothetical protein